MHPLVIQWISERAADYLRETRYAKMARSEARWEYSNPDPVNLHEIPRCTSHSGWMRTESEHKNFLKVCSDS